jgi:hypothetical protein
LGGGIASASNKGLSWGRRCGGRASKSVVGEGSGFISKGTGGLVIGGGLLGEDNISFDQWIAFVIEAVKCVDVNHHAGWAVKAGKVVSEKFLG